MIDVWCVCDDTVGMMGMMPGMMRPPPGVVHGMMWCVCDDTVGMMGMMPGMMRPPPGMMPGMMPPPPGMALPPFHPPSSQVFNSVLFLNCCSVMLVVESFTLFM